MKTDGPMVQLSKPWTWHNCSEWPTSMEVESLWAFHSQSSSGLYLQKRPSDQHAPWCRKAFLPTKSGSFLLVAVAGKIQHWGQSVKGMGLYKSLSAQCETSMKSYWINSALFPKNRKCCMASWSY